MLKKSDSKKAFKENVKEELKEKKPLKQALAIAYSEKRESEKKKKKEVSRSNVTIDIDDETSEVTIHILGEGLALQVAHDWVTLLRQHGFDVDIEQQPQTIN